MTKQIDRNWLLSVVVCVGCAVAIQASAVSTDVADVSSEDAEATLAQSSSTEADAAQSDSAATTESAAATQSSTAGAPTDVLPEGAQATPVPGDILNFQTDLFTGRFTYRVPIAVPPGRGNSQPNIVLGYNSSGGNGWCGVGWALDMGYIQRDTRYGVPRAWGTPSPLNQYENAYGFVFSFGGANTRLVSIGNNVYRAAEDSGAFLRFEVQTDGSWKVTDKNGGQFYFGDTTDSRMENPKFSSATVWQRTFRWALRRVVDANGNETVLSYTTDQNQSSLLYLDKIEYNGNVNDGLSRTHTVEFTLETRPTDWTITFQPGYRVETRKRLTDIRVKVNGALVRRYSLGYTTSPSTYRSLLTSITQYGSDDQTALPPLNFSYQVKPFEFEDMVEWPNVYSQGESSAAWNSIRSVTSDADYRLDLFDTDGDSFPDRVMRLTSTPYYTLAVQRNTGSGFHPPIGYYPWGCLDTQGQSNNANWGSVRGIATDATVADLVDINGDGFPDRVMRRYDSPYTNFVVQLNLGVGTLSGGFSTAFNWGPVTNESTAADWRSVRFAASSTKVDLVDMNGDGWPDRVTRKYNNPYDRFKVQLNTGSGFGPLVDWYPLESQGETGDGWNSVYAVVNGDTFVGLFDINGDGLPDRVMRKASSPYSQFAVQFNNGAGFEDWEYWGGTIDAQGYTGSGWGSPVGTDNGDTHNTLLDINGDGLLDRVMRKASSPYNCLVVQLNTGSGFASTTVWSNVSADSSSAEWRSIVATSSGDTKVDFVDMNGDGLPDRVMRSYSSPYDHFTVQLNKCPVPDLLCTIENGLGGDVQVAYTPSTQYDNRDRPWSSDPWNSGAVSLLPFPVWTVSSVSISDGFGNTNTTAYGYRGGMFDPGLREFRGFNRVEVTDPLGTKSVTYFHQGGGTNDVLNGEYQDAGSSAKKGIPYRTEIYGNAQNTNLFNLTLNKVCEVGLYTNAAGQVWNFPYIAQTISMEYEGQSNYRATAKQFTYDFTNGTLVNEINLGEVTSVNVANHTFSDTGNDSVSTEITYTTLGNNAVKPADTIIRADGNKVRETQFSYDSLGNLTTTLTWLDTSNSYIINSIGYDTCGNPTSAVNPVGIVSTTEYDSTYKLFPLKTITSTFTNQATFDERSAQVITTTDVNGLISSNVFDALYRLTETWVSTNAYGSCALWRTKSFYNLGGVTNGISSNYVRQHVFDGIDLTDGHVSYAYSDGLGRAIQARVESERSGQYRVTDTFYDERGNPEFHTLPYFESDYGFGTDGASKPGSLAAYDAIGRVCSNVSPCSANGSPLGDTGSPVSWSQVAYRDGSDPWAVVSTDSEGKVRKSYQDAYGRVIQIVEVVGGSSQNTYFSYDKVGNLTSVTDNAANVTTMQYDSLGRKTSMTDPDMGAWTYAYDAAGRLTEQTDAKGQKLKFYYNDEIGRLTLKEIYDASSAFVTNVTYTYDTSDDANYTVLKGQLYKVTDRQGWQKNGYDARGRAIKATRYLSVNSQSYTVQTQYDDADRATQVAYPGNVTKINYAFDNAGNMTSVWSSCGTISNETFYTAQSFDEFGRVTQFTYGNGVGTVITNYPNSKRLLGITSAKGGTNLQSLAYTYDTVSNIKSITDNVYSDTAGGALTSITYDDLHRLTGYTWNGAAKGFSYNAIGNMTQNGEFGGGNYTYSGTKPHAVVSANGKTYDYDACGNMTNRNGQALFYDEENQLVQVTTGTNTAMFGYSDGGERLWKYSGGQLTIWIGGIYEIKGGKTLCHVIANGRRVCTFEPQGGFCAWLQTTPVIASIYRGLDVATTWPFQQCRTPFTLMLIPLLGVLCASLLSRKKAQKAQGSLRFLRIFAANDSVSASLHRRNARQWEQYLDRELCPWFYGGLPAVLPALQAGLPVPWTRSGSPFAISPLRRFAHSLISVLLIVSIFACTTSQAEAATYDPVFYYYHADDLGSSNVMTDRNGEMVQHYEYTAFGKERFTDNTQAFNVSNRYTGQIFDDDTGLYYYGARYYDPELGRFIQPDSIVPSAGDPQTLNRYSYCGNNPLKYVDPSGHGGLFSDIGKALASMFTSPQTFAATFLGFVVGGPVGAAIGLGISTAATVATAMAAHYGGPTAGKIVGTVIGVALAAVGIAYGVDNENWTIVGASTLSLGSSAAGAAGEKDLANAFGWASLATSAAGAVNDSIEKDNAEPTNIKVKVDLPGVGKRGPEGAVSSNGTALDDLYEAAAEYMSLPGGNESSVQRLAQRVANELGAEGNVLIRGHSEGAEHARMLAGDLKALGVDQGRIFIQIAGSPIAKYRFAGVLPLSHVSVVHGGAGFVDPVHNAFGALHNPVQTGFGLLGLMSGQLSAHALEGYYGKNFGNGIVQ